MKPCPFCQTPSPLRMRTRDYNRGIALQIFRYHHCPSCGLWFLTPIPRNLGRYYPTEYYAFPDVGSLRLEAKALEGYKMNAILPFVSGGKLLEIGPSSGGFALLVKDAGFEVETIEMDARCCEFLRDHIGVRALHSDDPTAVLQTMDEKFDVIALWHVIEHLPNGWELLSEAAARLKPGGIIALATPNPNSFGFRTLRARWPHVDAPRHLRLLPIPFLQARARELNLEPVLMTTSDFGAYRCNELVWYVTAKRLIDFITLHTWNNDALTHRILRVLLKLFSPIEKREGQGAACTLVFQKPK